jgi:hypothetical protein
MHAMWHTRALLLYCAQLALGSSGSLLEFSRDFETRRAVIRYLHDELVKAREEAQRPFLLRRRALPYDRCAIQDIALIGLSSLVDIVQDCAVSQVQPLLEELSFLLSDLRPCELFSEWSPAPLPPEAALALDARNCFASTSSGPSCPPAAALIDSSSVWESAKSTTSSSSRLEHWGVLIPSGTRLSSVLLLFDNERTTPAEVVFQVSKDGDVFTSLKTVRVVKDSLTLHIPVDLVAAVSVRLQVRARPCRAVRAASVTRVSCAQFRGLLSPQLSSDAWGYRLRRVVLHAPDASAVYVPPVLVFRDLQRWLLHIGREPAVDCTVRFLACRCACFDTHTFA